MIRYLVLYLHYQSLNRGIDASPIYGLRRGGLERVRNAPRTLTTYRYRNEA